MRSRCGLFFCARRGVFYLTQRPPPLNFRPRFQPGAQPSALRDPAFDELRAALREALRARARFQPRRAAPAAGPTLRRAQVPSFGAKCAAQPRGESDWRRAPTSARDIAFRDWASHATRESSPARASATRARGGAARRASRTSLLCGETVFGARSFN